MHLLYIGNEGRLEQTVISAAAKVNVEVKTTVTNSGKVGIVNLLEQQITYDYVVIDCTLKDVKCLAIIDLILKNQIVNNDRICVIGLAFSEEEKISFRKRNICFVKYTFDLKDLSNHFSEVLAV